MTWRRGTLEHKGGRWVIVCRYEETWPEPHEHVEWHQLAIAPAPALVEALEGVELAQKHRACWLAPEWLRVPQIEIATRGRPLHNPAGEV